MYGARINAAFNSLLNILVAVTCLVVLWTAIGPQIKGKRRIESGLVKGATLHLSRRVDAVADRILILALNTRCVFCRSGLPYL